MRLITLGLLLCASPAMAKDKTVAPGDYAAVTAAITRTVDSYSGYRDVTGPDVRFPNRGRPLFVYAIGALTKTGTVFAIRVEGEFTGDVALSSVAANGKTLPSSTLPTKILSCNEWGCLRHVGMTFQLDPNTLAKATAEGLSFRVYTETTGNLDFTLPAAYIKAVADSMAKLAAERS